jgi:pantothenate kinase type III
VSAYLGSYIRESEERLQQQAALWEFQRDDRSELGADRILAALDAELEIVLPAIDRPP